MVTKKTLSFDELIQKKEPIYVENTTNPKGVLIIDFSNPMTGKSMHYTVQKTWIPMEISAAIPKNILEDSMDFRAYLQKGTLTLIPKDEAQKILSSEDAQDELKRINKSKYSNIKKTSNDDGEPSKNLELQTKETINPQIRNLILELDENPKEESAVISSIRTITNELKANDWGYILKETKSKKLRTYAKLKLSEIDDVIEE